MGAHEFIQHRIEELKRRVKQDCECIEAHQHQIEEFSRAVAESRGEIRELSELVDGAGALSI